MPIGGSYLGGSYLGGSYSTLSTGVLSLAECLTTYLGSIPGLGLTYNPDAVTPASTVFADFLPDSPVQAVAVLERAGAETRLTMTGMGQPQSLLDQPVVQIRVRSGPDDYATGNTLMQQVWGALQGLSETYLPDQASGMLFHLITATGYPAYLGVDVQERHEWSVSLRVLLENTQRVPA